MLLSSCRQTCLTWLQTLREKVAFARDDVRLQSLTQRTLLKALAGIQTFDIDTIYLNTMLENHEALSIFIQYCIIIDEKSGISADASFLDSLVTRHHRLLFRTKENLMKEITSQRTWAWILPYLEPGQLIGAHRGRFGLHKSCVSSGPLPRTNMVLQPLRFLITLLLLSYLLAVSPCVASLQSMKLIKTTPYSLDYPLSR